MRAIGQVCGGVGVGGDGEGEGGATYDWELRIGNPIIPPNMCVGYLCVYMGYAYIWATWCTTG